MTVSADKSTVYVVHGAGSGQVGVEKAVVYVIERLPDIQLDKLTGYAVEGTLSGYLLLDKLTGYAVEAAPERQYKVRLPTAESILRVKMTDGAETFKVKVSE